MVMVRLGVPFQPAIIYFIVGQTMAVEFLLAQFSFQDSCRSLEQVSHRRVSADSSPSASALCAEIGYGNAAGLLFRKGISGPPQGKIQTINDVTIPTPELDIPQATDTHSIPTSSPSAAAIPSSATRQQGQSHGLRDPITALAEPNAIPSEADSRATFEALSDAEKEAETAKLLDLFERLDRNPILSARAPNNPEPGSGGGGVGGGGQADIGGNAKGKNMSQVLRDRYVKVDKTWGEKERKEVESEEREDEESVKREMEAYRRRLGR